MAKFKTEDVVRDEAGKILAFENTDIAIAGVGQLTTFNQLGFTKISDKPDGWYLPYNINDVAIILETKNSNINITKDNCLDELKKNINIISTKYKKIIGILYNGYDVLVIKDSLMIDTRNTLFNKDYYLKLYNKNTIDKNLIYSLTKQINDNLHFNFGIKNLNHRMIFTACTLVAKRYNAILIKGMNWGTLHSSILSTLQKSYEEAKKQNQKLDLVGECFTKIQCNFMENQTAIDSFIDCIDKISQNIDSDFWNGEDVMGIFFNEFTRYKGKTEAGQVFTPDHITSLMYRVIGCSYKDNILDACCGSGAFLVKAMSNMIQEVGGINNSEEVRKIKQEKLFGIEFDKEVFTLACANMLIHKDGKTNFIQDDSRTENAGKWIKAKNITKVLMNPPFENKYGCLEIVENVLDNVNNGSICAFILPDTKLEIKRNKVEKWLKKHSLLKIIKLPDIFAGMSGISTSIFIFKTGEPQTDKQIFGCWIKEDGLETVKNQGRHDTKNKWQEIEDYWCETIFKQSGNDSIQWIKCEESLKYNMPEEEFKIDEKDFKKTILEYVLFNAQIDEKDFKIILIGNK
jgi:type I restriction enzyme M protein